MMPQQKSIAEHEDRESVSRQTLLHRPDRTAMALIACLVAVVVVIGAVIYQNLFFTGIQVEPQLLSASPGLPLTVQGRFLRWCRLSLETPDGNIQVAYRVDPFHLDRLTITTVPPELVGQIVHVKAQRFVGVLRS